MEKTPGEKVNRHHLAVNGFVTHILPHIAYPPLCVVNGSTTM